MARVNLLAVIPSGVVVVAVVGWMGLSGAPVPLPPEIPLHGMVTASDGRPMEGVAVSMRADGKPFIRTTVYTGRDGRYSFPPLVPPLVDDQYEVLVQAVGFEAGRSAVTLSARKAMEQHFTLRPLQQSSRDFSRQLSGVEWMASLPEDTPQDKRVKRLLGVNCNQCHTMGTTLQNRYDAAGWTLMLKLMESVSPSGTVSFPATGVYGRRNPYIHGYAGEMLEYLVRVRGPASELIYKPLPRITGDATQIVVTEYDVSPGHLPNHRVNQSGDDWSLGTPSHYESRSVHTHVVDLEGNVWFTDNVTPFRSFGKLDPRTGRVTDYRHLSRRDGGTVNVHDINVDQEGNIWFSNGRDGTLDKFDPKTDTFQHFPKPDGAPSTSVGQLVAVDSKGNIWGRFGGDRVPTYDSESGIEWFKPDPRQPGGAAKLDPKTGEYTFYKAVTPQVSVYSAGIDAEDNAWFTQVGVDRLGFVDSRTGEVGEINLSDPERDDILLTALDTKLAKFEPPSHTGPPWQKGPRRQTRSHWRALRFTSDKTQFRHQWFTLSKASRIAKVDIKTKKVTEYQLPYPYSFSYALTVDKNYVVWVSAMNTDRVFKFNPVTERWTDYQLPTLGTDSRFVDVDNTTDPPTVWLSYWGGPNKLARIQFRTAAAYLAAGR